jgi:Ca-activated chloride channel family protein
MTTTASALTGLDGERVALTDVSVSAVLRDLLSEVTVSQTYRNEEQENIEAVYTFPLPLDAVLLDLQVEIGGRVLKAAVIEKKAAEDAYEDAVASGDGAFMLQEIEPGLFTMNVGNLLPKEMATITFSYATLYRWADDRLRVFLPTTVAPRYGESRHAPHQAPEASLMVENQFSLKVEVMGSLREAQFVCPSHRVELAQLPDRLVITLNQTKAVMDRDFILNVRAPQATRSFTLCGADGDGLAAVASFQPFFPGLHQPRPLKLAIVVDCSGSMQGNSMEQAKQALAGILDALQPHDCVTMIAFGDTTKVLSKQLLPCNETNLVKAKHFAKELAANMGGTEIGSALRTTYDAIDAEAGDIFLVTDGEVSGWEAVVEEAKRSAHRIFTVGVGSAVSEAFVRKLAAETGGACELVSPQEGMADRVLRHFERMRAPRAARIAVIWPEGARDVAPNSIGTVFEGDTVVACARFDQRIVSGEVALEIETEGGEIVRQRVPIAAAPSLDATNGLSTIARIAASARMKELDKTAALDVALRYRLVSPWTNWLVIDLRADGEKSLDLPALRKVPQTLAAGWGGAGAISVNMEMMQIPMFCRKSASTHAGRIRTAPPEMPEHFLRLLTAIEDDPSLLEANRAMDLLERAGIPGELDAMLRHTAYLGLKVDGVAVIILAALLSGPLGTYLSSESKHAVVLLQKFAEQSMRELAEIGHHGRQLLRVIERARARQLLRGELFREIEDMRGRLEEIPDFLKQLQVSTRRLNEQLKDSGGKSWLQRLKLLRSV